MDRTNIEDIFQLTDLQLAMLLHRLQTGEEESGFLLLRGIIRGEIEMGFFEQAWQDTVDHHPVLRTSIHWEGLSHPVQVVSRKAHIHLGHHDWREMPVANRTIETGRFLEKERELGLDLTVPPVMRLALLRSQDQHHEFIWTCHHILLDGWSGALILKEVFNRYEGLRTATSPSLPPARSFKDYATWLRDVDDRNSSNFWRRYLAGADRSLLLRTSHGANAASGRKIRSKRAELRSVSNRAIATWARNRRVTSNCLFLGSWALLLSERTSAQTPVFGLTVSGRGAPMTGIESMIGMFANTLPIALGTNRTDRLDDWFKEVFKRQIEIQRYEHCPLGRILDWSGIPLRHPLFDTLLVYANFPVGSGRGNSRDSKAEKPEGVELVDFQGDVTSAFPCTVVIRPGEALEIEIRYDESLTTEAGAQAILDRFLHLLERVMDGTAETIGELIGGVAPSGVDGHSTDDDPQRENPREEWPGFDPLEAQLARIWRDLIDRPEVGPDDDFFLAGGHSLLVPRLLQRVSSDFGVKLSFGTLHRSPTIRNLAAVLRSEKENPTWRSVVPIREVEGGPAFFLIHSFSPDLRCAYDLVRHLPADFSVYGLQPAQDDDPSIRKLAARYLEEIRSLRPARSFHLGGSGFGGCIAFEMACQLADEGTATGRLILIHPSTPGLDERRTPTGVRPFWKAIFNRGPGDRANSPLDGHPEVTSDTDRHHQRALEAYSPGVLRGDAWLLTTGGGKSPAESTWRRSIKGKLTIVRVEGTDASLQSEPEIVDVGRKIAAILTDASPR